MRIKRVHSGQTVHDRTRPGKRRPGKYDSLGICPNCSNKKGNKLLKKSRKGNFITNKIRCAKCGKVYDIFRVIGTKMNIKSVS